MKLNIKPKNKQKGYFMDCQLSFVLFVKFMGIYSMSSYMNGEEIDKQVAKVYPYFGLCLRHS